MRALTTKEEFLKKIKSNLGNEFNNYDFTNTSFKNTRAKILVVCKLHGEFEIFTKSLMYYKHCGCPKCHYKTKRLTNEQFIKEAKKINSQYDYSLVDYKNSRTKVKIICPEHGSFFARPGDFLRDKNGCPSCRYLNVGKKLASNTEEFIKKAKEVHGSKYDYSLVYYINNSIKVKIICPEHGLFWQKPNAHLSYQGCPKCRTSHGESHVRNFLKKNNIVFEEQKRFENCKDDRKLPFDFYVPEKNLLIEYNGIQHYRNSFGIKIHEWHRYKHHDWLKRKFAKENGFNLLTISYKDDKIIENILKEELEICSVV